MNKSNFLVSTASALAIVATIGLAVAQTTPPTTPGDAGATMGATTATPAATPSTPAVQSPGAMNNTSPATNTGSAMTTERPSQIDRN